MPNDAPFEITTMQPWMIPGMAQLQSLEYKVDPSAAEAKIRNWFDSDYSHRRGSIVLVGVAGERVIAVQSYSPWPYALRGRSYRSLQSGATLVHADFRGRKIFQRMLVEGNRIATSRGDDFFMGFPVDASYPGFIKDKWLDLGRLRWWIKPLRPLALAARGRINRSTSHNTNTLRTGEALATDQLASFPPEDARFELMPDKEFLEWRYRGRTSEVRYYEHARASRRVGMAVKLTTKHGFRELMVGKIRTHNAGPAFVASALMRLGLSAYQSGVAAMSTALLDPLPSTWSPLVLAGFIPAKPTTPLIVRPLRELPEVTEKTLWRDICIEDIDTW